MLLTRNLNTLALNTHIHWGWRDRKDISSKWQPKKAGVAIVLSD